MVGAKNSAVQRGMIPTMPMSPWFLGGMPRFLPDWVQGLSDWIGFETARVHQVGSKCSSLEQFMESRRTTQTFLVQKWRALF